MAHPLAVKPRLTLMRLFSMVTWAGAMSACMRGLTDSPKPISRLAYRTGGKFCFGAAIGTPYGRPWFAGALFAALVWLLLGGVVLIAFAAVYSSH